MAIASRGYHATYHDGETNHCPGCGRSQWIIGRVTAECVFCGTALPLQEQRTVARATVIGFSTRPGTGPLE
jgi:tRNA(Ile2) C34 agmatinyltransferase TiaS